MITERKITRISQDAYGNRFVFAEDPSGKVTKYHFDNKVNFEGYFMVEIYVPEGKKVERLKLIGRK